MKLQKNGMECKICAVFPLSYNFLLILVENRGIIEKV